MIKVIILSVTVLVFSTVAALNVFADFPSAGSILSQERQQLTQRSIEKLQKTPQDENIETAPDSETKSEDEDLISEPESKPDNKATCQ